ATMMLVQTRSSPTWERRAALVPTGSFMSRKMTFVSSRCENVMARGWADQVGADWHRHPGILRRSDPIQREPKGGSAARGLAQERVERRPSKCGRGLLPFRTPWGCERPDCVRCETRRHTVLEGMNPVAWRRQMPGICH